ncbi:MAG: hypothetical protein Q4G22_10615 [Paracoccus sp. (in: a-proteobacteria)]|uniref:hypothetical protein n=1 Tax=Paracoccus sp. TaxID=267 RepID=UPI0026E0AF42|nr:hypothetical protein [Paracoccus sp. (in: a-proteobacteria)]MDO5632278.1 hypothetical protein [Paracoccus sp. (in: a-proteobacteria)]
MSDHETTMTPEELAAQNRAENRLAAAIFACIAGIVVVLAFLVIVVGPQMLGFIGLAGTVLFFVIMLAFTAGK